MTDISFPRGGNRSGSSAPKHSDTNGDLFKVVQENVKEKSKRKKKSKSENEEENSENLLIIDRLTTKNVCEGMVVLACVSEVRSYNVIFSLPGGVFGSLPITNMPNCYVNLLQEFSENPETFTTKIPSLKDFFQIGNCYPVRIVDCIPVEGSFVRKFTLSLNPKSINEGLSSSLIYNGMVLLGAVDSCEDHGYIIDVGIHGLTGFLSKNEADFYIRNWNSGHSLSIGQPLQLAVSMPELEEQPLETRMLILSTKQKLLENKPTNFDNISLQNIIPGINLPAQVIQIGNSGLVVQCLGYDGCIWKDHLRNVFETPKSFNVADDLVAMVLFVHPMTKIVHMTLVSKPTSKNIHSRFGSLVKGDIVENAAIVEVYDFGVFLQLANNVKGFAKVSQLSDKRIDNVKEKYKSGQKCKCRVMGFDYLGKIVKVSLKPSIFQETMLNEKDMKAGGLVTGTVTGYFNNGIFVKLSYLVSGFIPMIQNSDIPSKNPEKLHPIGSEIDCRVLQVASEGRSSHLLTCKKVLIQSKIAPLTSIKDAQHDSIVEGIITNISNNGLILSFYNGVSGYVAPSNVSTEFIENLNEVFFRGQVVRSKVLFSSAAEKKLKLSLKMSSWVPFGVKQMGKGHNVGEIVKVQITSKTDIGLEIKILPDGPRGFLYTMHLSDHLNLCQFLYNALMPDDIIEEVVIITTRGKLLVTRKKIFLRAAKKGKMITSFETVRKDEVVPAFIKGFMQYGIILEVGGGVTGVDLIKNHKSSMAFVCHQSLFVKVSKVLDDLRKVHFSSQLLDVINKKNSWAASLNHIESYINDLDYLRNQLKKNGNLSPHFDALSVGSVVDVRVIKSSPSGLVCKLEGTEIRGFASVIAESKLPNVGSKTEAVILHLDYATLSLELSVDPVYVRRFKNEPKLLPKLTIRAGNHVKAVVLTIKEKYTLCLLTEESNFGILVYLPNTRHLNDPVGIIYKTGEKLNVSIQRVKESCVIGVRVSTDDADTEIALEQLKDLVEIRKFSQDDKNTLEQRNDVEQVTALSEDNAVQVKNKKKRKKRSEFKDKNNVDNETLNSDVNINISNGEVSKCAKKSKKKAFEVIEIPKEKATVEKIETVNSKSKKRVVENAVSLNEQKIEPISKKKAKKREANSSISVVENECKKTILGKKEEQLEIKEIKRECKNSYKLQIGDFRNSTLHTTHDQYYVVKLDSNEYANLLKIHIKNSVHHTFKQGSSIKVKVVKITDDNIEVEPLRDFEELFSVPISDESSANGCSIKSNQLSIEQPFLWDVDATPNLSLLTQRNMDVSSDDEDVLEEENDLTSKKKKSRSSQEARKKEDEELLRKREERLMDVDREPESTDDYERLLMASPNNSKIWMKYMAFQLQQAEIEKARAVGERALKSISFREEREKLNVWVALLNLESMYGTQESLASVFQRAVQANEPLLVYQYLVNIYINSNKNQEAEQLFQTMLKKFRQEPSVWVNFGLFYYKTNQLDSARKHFDKSLTSLVKRHHIEVISKFAQLEFKFGDPERGKTLFKNILTNFPKRIDLWSVFVDILVKQGEYENARQNLECLVSMSLPAKKMKFIFKKFLDFEKEHGTDETVENVRVKALEYVASSV